MNRFSNILPIVLQKGRSALSWRDSVSIDEGTGFVHSAPAFGEVDFYACQREGIELVYPVDNNGLFTKEIPEYQGLFVKDADKEIIKRLKKRKGYSSWHMPPPLSLLLEIRYSTDLQSSAHLVCCCEKIKDKLLRLMIRSIGRPNISNMAVLENGWKMRAIGQSAETAIGGRRFHFGDLMMEKL